MSAMEGLFGNFVIAAAGLSVAVAAVLIYNFAITPFRMWDEREPVGKVNAASSNIYVAAVSRLYSDLIDNWNKNGRENDIMHRAKPAAYTAWYTLNELAIDITVAEQTKKEIRAFLDLFVTEQIHPLIDVVRIRTRYKTKRSINKYKDEIEAQAKLLAERLREYEHR